MRGIKVAIFSFSSGLAIGVALGAYIISSSAAFVRTEDAEKLAEQSATTRLLPYCVAAALADPDRYQVLLDLNAAPDHEKPGVLAEAGWATPIGASAPDKNLASACVAAVAR